MAGVSLDDDRSVPESNAAVISETLRNRHLELRSSMELFNDAFFFWWENIRFYLLYGVALAFAMITSVNYLASSARPALMSLGDTASTPEQLMGGIFLTLVKFFAVIGLVSLVAYAALLTGTVKIAQGYKAGIINSTISGLLNLKSILWIIVLQGVAIGVALFPVTLAVAMLSGGSQSGRLLSTFLSGPLLSAIGAPFMMGMFVYLDQDARGLRAMAAGVSLVGNQWLKVAWRFFVFGVFLNVLMLFTQLSLFGAAIALFFAPGMYVIYPWFLYTNLRQMRTARENRASRQTAAAAGSPA